MNTTDQDTQPMTLSELDTDAEDWRDGWPTERIVRQRTGARRGLRWSAVAPWVLLTVLGGAALGGGAWFALTANENLRPATTTGANPPSPVNPVPAQGGVIVLPANGMSRAAARPAVARTSPAAPSTARSTKSAPPTAARTTQAAAADSAPSTAPATDTRSSSSPTTTTSSSTPDSSAPAAPVPVSTAPDPSNPDCVVVTYSDGATKDVCSPPAPATSGAGTGSPS